ncbi:MAG TPA: hypothetical protein VGL72_10090 [Bryobacteraceae bacterium]|jgi:hypothetical protein
MKICRSLTTAIALILLSSAAALRADTVSFSTTGSFDGAGNSIVFGTGLNTLTINFNGLADTVNDDPFSFISLGQFQTSVTGSGASITSGTTFTLDITQLQPTAGSANMLGTLSGSISQNQSTGAVTFSLSSVTIGGETYSLINNNVPLVPPSNTGLTTLQATLSPVPEPTAASLLIFSIVLAVGMQHRLRRRS